MDRRGSRINAVVDTNVIAYYLLATEPFVDEARRFWHVVGQPFAPTLWAAELANVIWMAVRTGVMAAEEGQGRLELAGRLHVRSVSIRSLWHGALARALTTDLAVYDTLFVELATRRRLPLATFDRRILNAFPDVARLPGALVPA